MSNIQMLPGTNELIYSQNGQNKGSQLFRKYGYNIQRPHYRDYYNGLNRYGNSFADDLGSILGGLAGGLSKSGIFGSTSQAVTRSPQLSLADPTAQQIAALNPGSALTPGNIPAFGSFTGNPVLNGSRDARYQYMLNHFQYLAQQYPHGVAMPYPVAVSPFAYQVSVPLSGSPQQDMPADAQQDYGNTDSEFSDMLSGGFNKDILIIGVIILVIVIYKRFIK